MMMRMSLSLLAALLLAGAASQSAQAQTGPVQGVAKGTATVGVGVAQGTAQAGQGLAQGTVSLPSELCHLLNSFSWWGG
jgi:uncharacterized lipoprotein YbaY